MKNPVSKTLVRSELQNLSGFRGYPKPGPGEEYFVQQLANIVGSVCHLQAVVAAFDGEFPTLEELRRVALNLRPRYVCLCDQVASGDEQICLVHNKSRAQVLKEQCGEAKSFGSVSAAFDNFRTRDRTKEVWDWIALHDKPKDLQNVSLGRFFQVWRRQFEFEINSAMRPYLESYERDHPWIPPVPSPPVPSRRITEEDFRQLPVGDRD